ncbi:TetR/AcrR family transcriptional regulator [Congregibacter brevis]|uniref:TetR/AcrR family transcriptional regulator n=1 Tax=Congregibacter brevis TaxID=3081201 RepID=A0ABZ0IEQ2_9GAMM|nr:TetR/AcrR family transcriptional regulator [Congregibacter sp. IMCC45268]
MPKKKTNNRSRVLETCRHLMNVEGAQAIGTTRLCDELEISPGNLYYHFKNKEEIVRALFEELAADFRVAFGEEPPESLSPKVFADFYVKTLDVAYDYRFFFSGLLHLLRQDPLLNTAYLELQDWALEGLAGVAAQAAREGNLRVQNSQKRYRAIAVNTWLIWSNWVRYLEISKSGDPISRKDMLLGIEQIFDVLSGHLEPAYEAAVRRHLKNAQ